MASTGALLSDAERASFSTWLTTHVESAAQRGVSKKKIAFRLGADSSQRLNRYLVTRGSAKPPMIPTALVLAQIADEIGVAWPEAYLRAGYFREVVGIVNSIAAFAATRSATDREAAAELREMLVAFAIDAFPRRDVRRIAEPGYDCIFKYDQVGALITRDFVPEDNDDISALKRHLDPLLARAAEALGQYDVPALVRRAVAGEYVNAWADRYDHTAAERVRGRHHLVSAILEPLEKEG